MKKALLVIGCFVATVLFCILVTKGVENKAISYEEAIENTAGNIRVEEKRRFDLIPNLVECVKAYDEHEYKTLVDLVKGRSGNSDSKFAADIKTMINAVAEAYPDLKSQKNYQELMNELSITENKIAEMRKFYNKNVTTYKRYTRQFPSKQFLGLCGYEVKEYTRLEFENSSVDAPKVNF
jgi:LemA protein